MFLGFPYTYETDMYHLLTVNVRTRTKINIPPIHFVTENSHEIQALFFC